MTVKEQTLTKEDRARPGKAAFERIRQSIEPGNAGRIIAIDVLSGSFDLDCDTLPAGRRLLARVPDAQIFFIRIGHPSVYDLGFAIKPA